MTILYEQTSADIKEGYSDIIYTGQLIQAGSSMIGSIINKVSLYASTNSGTITGDATCTIQDSSGTTMATIGTADTSSLTSATPTDYTLVFQNTANTYQCAEGDRVVISWGTGSDPPSILWLWRSNGSTITNTVYQYYSGSWTSRDGDITAKFETSVSSSTLLFPPPVAYI